MKELIKGEYFSSKKNQLEFNNVLLTDSEYRTQKAVPWHYHENAYFSYIISGHLKEVNKKKSIHCIPGTLIFNNTFEPHCNTEHTPITRQFYIEIQDNWFKNHHINKTSFRNELILNDPFLISSIKKIHQEFKINDTASEMSIEGLLLLAFGKMTRSLQIEKSVSPLWVSRIKEIINERFAEKITLQLLSNETGIHPIYISNNFNKYFHYSLSEYLRKIRVEKSITLLRDKKIPLAQIALCSGFSDQSHYIKCFKEIHLLTPSEYRSIYSKP